MDRFKYSNATTADLWSCLEEASEFPVSELMDCWVDHVGFPILKVIKRFNLNQSWHLPSISADKSDKKKDLNRVLN